MVSSPSKIIGACPGGIYCSGGNFNPYNYYRIVEGEVAPYQVGFFRINFANSDVEGCDSAVCYLINP